MLPTLLLMSLFPGPAASAGGVLIDDFAAADGRSRQGTRWQFVTDQVMGGQSTGVVSRRQIDGRWALCLTGAVSLANNGGFVQVHLDLSRDGSEYDAGGFRGVRLLVQGNGAKYNVHLKSSACTLPWQAYRASFETGPAWQEVRLPFGAFTPYRLTQELEPGRLRRIGILAIGEAMQAEVCVAEVGFY